MAVFNTLMADSGSNRTRTTTPATQTTTTSTKNNNGFFSKLAGAVNNWADKLVGNNPNAGKSGLDNPYNFVRPGREGDIAVTAGGGVPVSSSKPGSSSSNPSTSGVGASLTSNKNNAVNNIKAGLPTTNASTVYTPLTPAIQSQTNTSGVLNNNVGEPNIGSSGVITELPIAPQNTNPGTLFGQSLLDQLANIKGVNTEQGTSGTAESSKTAADAKDQEDTNQQAEAEQDAATGLKALLSRWFYNPNAGKSGLDNPYNFVRLDRAGDIAVTAGGGVPGYSSKRTLIDQRIAEQAAGRQQRAEAEQKAAQQQRIDDLVNGSLAGDWNAFNRAMQQAGIENPQIAGNYTLRNAIDDYFNKAGTYSSFGGGQAGDTAYFYEPGYGSLPLQTTNGVTTNIDGSSAFTTIPGSLQGDPTTYGYGSLDNATALQGPGASAESVLNGLITAGYPSDTAAQLASILGLETPAAEEETPKSNGGNNGGGNGGGGRSGGNSGTYNGGGNVATDTTTGEVNDYLYTLPEVSNSVSGALLNRLLPSGYDYNYNARMQSRLGDLQAAEDYYRNSAIPTLQNVYQNQAANTLANYLQAIRANRQSGLTSGANRGAQLASEVQAMQSANKENSENLNNTVGTNLANMLSTLTGKRATAGTDTAGELQPYTTSMDNALSQVLMYYLYGNAAAEVNNGGLRRQNTVNYTAV